MGQNENRALVGVLVVLCFSTFALGSAHRWAACLSSLLAILAVVPIAGSRRRLSGQKELLVLISIPLLATLLQLLPLPLALTRLIAPVSYELAKANAAAYGHALPSFLSLSQDWPATLVELCKFCGYFAFASVCIRLSMSRRARQWILLGVAGVGTAVALCALGHRALGAKSLFGLYTPEFGYQQAISPFFNPNHLAGYLAFVTPVCVGLAVQRKSLVLSAMAAVCALTSLQAVSRGGLVSLSLGLLVTLLLLASSYGSRIRRIQSQPISPYWLALGLGLALVVVALFGATAGSQLLDFDLQAEQQSGKFLAWRFAPDLLASSPWVGVGRGAFEFAFTPFQPATGVVFSHIENEYIQTVLDWGIIVALLVTVALGAFFRCLYHRGAPDALSAGAIGALVALLVQSTVDFGLQLPGVALPLIAVVATLVPAKLTVEADKALRKRLHVIRLLAIAGAVLICALAASAPGTPATEEIAASTALQDDYTGPPNEVLRQAESIGHRHPSSYYLAASTANSLWRLRDERAFAALARALTLNPNHSGVHLLAARMLESSQRPRQALGEYQQALAMPANMRKVLTSLVRAFPDPDDIVSAVPPDLRIELVVGSALMGMKQASAALALVHRSVARGNVHSYPLYELGVQAALVVKENTWAVETSRQAYERFGSNESFLLYLSALRSAGLSVVAMEALVERNDNSDIEVLDALALVQIELKNFTGAKKTLEILMKNVSSSKARSGVHLRFATIEDAMGNHHQAKWHREQAASLRSH